MAAEKMIGQRVRERYLFRRYDKRSFLAWQMVENIQEFKCREIHPKPKKTSRRISKE
jgi:hypothetical protein